MHSESVHKISRTIKRVQLINDVSFLILKKKYFKTKRKKRKDIEREN